MLELICHANPAVVSIDIPLEVNGNPVTLYGLTSFAPTVIVVALVTGLVVKKVKATILYEAFVPTGYSTRPVAPAASAFAILPTT